MNIDEYYHPSQFDQPLLFNDSIDTDVSNYASNVMNYALLMNLSGQFNLCTTEKLLSNCFPDEMLANERRKLFGNTVKEARENIQHLFGCDLVNDSFVKEVNNSLENISKTKIEKKKISAKDRWYVLTFAVDDSEKHVTAKISSNDVNHTRGVLMFFLGQIVLSSFHITEAKLIDILSNFGIISKHEANNGTEGLYFEDYMKVFCSAGYVKKRVLHEKTESGKSQYEVMLGKRTYLEIGLPNIWAFLGATCDISLTETEKRALTGAIEV